MFDDVKTLVGALVTVVSGGTLLGVTVRKVNTHDRVIFQSRGGLNVINNDTCAKYRSECKDNIVKDLRAILDEKLKEHSKEQENQLILEELRRLNKQLIKNEEASG